MNTDAIIKQLEKALNKKDDKELRLRVEVLVDMLKETRSAPMPVLTPTQPATPLQPYYESTPTPKPPYKVTSQSNKINGAGPIVGGGEQITYQRPKGT